MRYFNSPTHRPKFWMQAPRQWSALVLSASVAVLSSCSPNTSPSNPSPTSPQSATSPTATDALQVVTTFLPITQFTQAVAGDRAQVSQLLPPNTGPHDYQAKPEEVQRLAEADVLVQNGLELEEFLTDLVENAANPDLKIIDSSQGIATISHEAVQGEAHAEGEVHAEAGHDHEGEFNPHIWLDPKRAMQQVATIRDGLTAADPAGETEYTANAAALIEQLRQLNAEIATTLKPYVAQTFVAFHDFALYFAQSYGLKAQFLVDVPEDNPSPADVKRVFDQVKASQLKTILTEPQAGADTLAALAKDLNVTVSVFDPTETADATAIAPDYYFTTMRQNVQSLVSAFSGSTQSTLPLWIPSTIATVPQPVRIRF